MTDIADDRITTIFRKLKLKCKNPEEAKFVQNGIETVVKQIVYQIKKFGHCKTKAEQTECTELDNEDILYVGSFYEGTKNRFPDEFDFILILETFKEKPDEIQKYLFLSISDTFNDEICKILSRREFTDSLKYENSSGLHLRFDNVDQVKGPGVKIKLSLVKEAKSCGIYVDLTPAFKIESDRLSVDVGDLCTFAQFSEEVLNDQSYLILKNNVVTFTETEKRFMKTILSNGHKMVYRILKYLINGENDGDILEKSNISNRPSFSISTFKIKCVMIHHHYECQNATVDCIPNILQVIHDCHRDNDWRNISRSAKRDFDDDNVDKYVRKKGTMVLRTLRDQSKTVKRDVESFAKTMYNILSETYFVLQGCRMFVQTSFFKQCNESEQSSVVVGRMTSKVTS